MGCTADGMQCRVEWGSMAWLANAWGYKQVLWHCSKQLWDLAVQEAGTSWPTATRHAAYPMPLPSSQYICSLPHCKRESVRWHAALGHRLGVEERAAAALSPWINAHTWSHNPCHSHTAYAPHTHTMHPCAQCIHLGVCVHVQR